MVLPRFFPSGVLGIKRNRDPVLDCSNLSHIFVAGNAISVLELLLMRKYEMEMASEFAIIHCYLITICRSHSETI